MSESKWKNAMGPNYNLNVDLSYPYSELPYTEEYKVVKLPTHDGLVGLVDYWGEGKVKTPAGVLGLPQSYNVNHQYRLVSKGDDIGRKIPNRIPIRDENHCDTSRYITDDSVKTITVMNHPIEDQCAQDIARMINGSKGVVIAYGFDDHSQDIKNLKYELKKKGIFHCHEYPLPFFLDGITMYKKYHAFVNTAELKDELFVSIKGGEYFKAVEIFKTLHENNGDRVAADIVNKILNEGVKETTTLVYHLWNKGAREVVLKYFPEEYKWIFNNHTVRIVSKYFSMPLKLDSNTEENFRFAWGDGMGSSNYRLKWNIIPELVDGICVFKILNLQYNQYLLMDASPNQDYGDRKVWGYALSGELRYRWSFDPIKINNQLLFLVVNRQYNQGWKLNWNTDSQGDRGLWGHNGNVADTPLYYGFVLEEID